MEPLYSTPVSTDWGSKDISVYSCNILDFPEQIDILAVSAFVHGYRPTRGTVLGALDTVGISVRDLAAAPEIDLRALCNVWLSRHINVARTRIRRVGCIEFTSSASFHPAATGDEQSLLNSIKAFFQMLDIASVYGIQMDTIALPLLGAGNQNISASILLIPILNECISFLRRNNSVHRICFIEYNPMKADLICSALKSSYAIRQAGAVTETVKKHSDSLAFISYSIPDKAVADMLCKKLENQGIPVWYAPRNVEGPYAGSIARAIEKATHFIVILSENSMKSEHVLNEVDLAFQKLPNKIKFKPIRSDEVPLSPSMNYYLSRQHWMYAHMPPLEQRLEEFALSLSRE